MKRKKNRLLLQQIYNCCELCIIGKVFTTWWQGKLTCSVPRDGEGGGGRSRGEGRELGRPGPGVFLFRGEVPINSEGSEMLTNNSGLSSSAFTGVGH